LVTYRIRRGLNVLAFIMIFFVMPETKQRTLEDLDHICKYHRLTPAQQR